METGYNFVLKPAHRPGDEEADRSASEDIQRIMDADVDPGVGHNCGNRIKNRRQAFYGLSQKKRSRKNIDRVGRRKGIGCIAVGKHMDIFKNVTGPHPADHFFEDMAGELVCDRKRKTDENQKNQPGFSLFPQDPDSQGDEDIGEVSQFRHERHEPIEERILALLIDQTKQDCIQRSEKEKHGFTLCNAENILPLPFFFEPWKRR